MTAKTKTSVGSHMLPHVRSAQPAICETDHCRWKHKQGLSENFCSKVSGK